MDSAQQRMKREKMSLLKKKNRKSIGDYCLTSDLVDRLERLRGTYLRSVIRVRVTVAGCASLVAVSFENVTCWMNVCRSCCNHTSHVFLSCAVVRVSCENVIETRRMCDKLRERTPFNVICGKYSWMTSKRNRHQ